MYGILFINLNSDVLFRRSIAHWKALSEDFPICVCMLYLARYQWNNIRIFVFTRRVVETTTH